jgi:ribosomal protein L11 methyltransferase
MSWLSVKIFANHHNGDLISDALMELGALSTSIEDANAETPDEQAIFSEPGDPPPGIWKDNVVTALFNQDTDIAETIKSLSAQLKLPSLHYTVEIIEEQDWVRMTQSQFDPICIHEYLWIVPSWHESPNPDALNIVLDPGLAFGSGSHPTTHLCLSWLKRAVEPSHTVLDYGCGSGILAIAAKKLGANTVVGTDIDEQAITSSQYNAEQNAVDIPFYLPKTLPHLQSDIVVANILSSALTVLAPALAGYCKSGGKIALSGILMEQADTVATVYSEWFDMDKPTYMESWALLTGTKK